MAKTVKINSHNDLDILLRVARKFFDEKGPSKATISILQESLSDRQRGLYWMWQRINADDRGYTLPELHYVYKENVFLPVYLADPENHTKLVETVNSMKRIKNGVPEKEYSTLREFVIENVSHKDSTVRNMMDVLKHIEVEAGDRGVILPQPPGPRS